MAREPSFFQLTTIQQELLKQNAEIVDVPAAQTLLEEGKYVKQVPIILEGLVKVFTQRDGKELLLYYIKPGESCIMSFSSAIRNGKSMIYAKTLENSKILLLPAAQINSLREKNADISTLFLELYHLRYQELLDTIHHILFNKLDERLYNYLKQKHKVTSQNPLNISHKQIADELGTAREVISRTLKKLETENLVSQEKNGIRILRW